MTACVLVFAGLDPSGGAGIAADVLAVAAQGAHALPVVTALTVQDNERVHAVQAVDAALIARQALALADTVDIAAVKIGIPGSRANAEAIAAAILHLRVARPLLPVVLDPVLASGRGDALAQDDARQALAPLLALATLVTPNLPEAELLGLLPYRAGGAALLVTGGHARRADVVNRWHHEAGVRAWRWPRLAGEFHGSGCTLAAAVAARLALGEAMEAALESAQAYVHAALEQSFAIAPGQRIPQRWPRHDGATQPRQPASENADGKTAQQAASACPPSAPLYAGRGHLSEDGAGQQGPAVTHLVKK